MVKSLDLDFEFEWEIMLGLELELQFGLGLGLGLGLGYQFFLFACWHASKLYFFQMIGFYSLLAGSKARTEVLPLALAHILWPIYKTSLIMFLKR